MALLLVSIDPSLALRSGIPELSFRECLMNDQNFLLHFPCDAWVSCDVAMSWILLWIEVMWPCKLHQSALLKSDMFLLTWLIRGMFTSREASTTSWSEMPGLTITFLQEDGLFVTCSM